MKITEVMVDVGRYTAAVVRWSPDGSSNEPKIDLLTRHISDVSDGRTCNLTVSEARSVVEALHEAIGSVSAWEAEQAAPPKAVSKIGRRR